MTLLETPIPGLILMQPRVFGDERGYFFESLRRDALPADMGFTTVSEVSDL